MHRSNDDLGSVQFIDGVASRLRMARLDRRSTIREMARLAYCSESLLSRVENRKQSMSLRTLARLAAALEVDLAWLLEGDIDGASSPGVLDTHSGRGPSDAAVELQAGLPDKLAGPGVTAESMSIAAGGEIDILGLPDRLAACIVTVGTLDVVSGEATTKVAAGEFFRLSGDERLTFRSTSASDTVIQAICRRTLAN